MLPSCRSYNRDHSDIANKWPSHRSMKKNNNDTELEATLFQPEDCYPRSSRETVLT